MNKASDIDLEQSAPPLSGYRCTVTGASCHFGKTVPLIDRSGRTGETGVARCLHCGIGVTMPPLDDIAALYSDRSSQDFQPATRGLVHVIKRIAFRRQARAVFRRLGSRPRRLIDFGCGSGLLTRCLGDVSPECEVIGMDYHDHAPHDLVDRPYLSSAAAYDMAGTADAVTAMHVLEHGDDLSALLGRIADFARPGGLIMIEVPYIDCVWASVFGRFWDAWYVPFHRVHFTRESLRAVVEQQGLVVEQEGSVSVPGLGRSIANLLGCSNGFVFILLTVALQPIQWLGEVLSGRPSGLWVTARR